MNHGCNRSLNVFQPTPSLYYNNGVCQYKRGEAWHPYIFHTEISDLTDLVPKIRAQYSAYS
jgi:hypothetical protein